MSRTAVRRASNCGRPAGRVNRKTKQRLQPRRRMRKANLQLQRRTQLHAVDVTGEAFVVRGTGRIDERAERGHDRNSRQVGPRFPAGPCSPQREKCPPSQIGRLPLLEQTAAVMGGIVDAVDLEQVELGEPGGPLVGQRRIRQSDRIAGQVHRANRQPLIALADRAMRLGQAEDRRPDVCGAIDFFRCDGVMSAALRLERSVDQVLRFVVQEAVPLRNRLVLRLNPRELAEKVAGPPIVVRLAGRFD
jgi:hypothetical protein